MQWHEVTRALEQGNNVMLSGLDGTCQAYFISELIRSLSLPLVYITAEEEQAWDTARSLRGILGNQSVHVMPPRDVITGGPLTESPTNVRRMSFLYEALNREKMAPGVLILPVSALLFETVAKERFQKALIRISSGSLLPVEQFLHRLVTMGYTRHPMVENPGQFAVRGGIVDIYPVNSPNPVRMEMFGDEVENLRSFSTETQRSQARLKEVIITLASENEITSEGGRVWEYLAPEWPVWIDDLSRVRETWSTQTKRYRKLLQQDENNSNYSLVGIDEFNQVLIARKSAIYHSFFPRALENVAVQVNEHVAQHESEPFWAKPDHLWVVLRECLAKGWRAVLAIPDKTARETLSKNLAEYDLQGKVELVSWKIEKGFVSSSLATVVISDRDLGGKRAVKSGFPKLKTNKMQAEDLIVGEHIVHENHGIGVFQGITNMEVNGVHREYFLIQFAGNDRLYLPVDKIDFLSRYKGGDAHEPKLNKLGGSEWERTKNRVRESIQDLTAELLSLYAAREKASGFAFSPDTVWQKEFEEEFEYEETPDQARAIIETKADMEKSRPMDRLICGDVGYGKTEVALRAAFKAVMDHKQVAILVPTTILAEQHYSTFAQRLEPYPAVVEVLSRFRNMAQQKKIIDEIRRGVADIVIGTHRLLSRDVQFKDLGLLIIDEEHRFGVRQKERIKVLAETVDVISLSATPIPRTLHMALTGLRDLSLIETPPPERYPINTYIMEYNPDIVREAIIAEVERGGQVFYVHNRIHNMERVREEIKKLVPEITIDMAHGRMDENQMAAVMARFVSGKSSVLLCTTIIESGLDMPNVNTMIVDEADRMGLAQLYQLRGRIGRSNRVAYAYLTYRPDKAVTENAQKRLNAIREFTELGSGMKIALRDLEIRGAGNILGPEQHGYIAAVGFDLYCRLLEEQTAQTRGEAIKPREQPQLDIKVDTYVPDEYIEEPALKIQVYRQTMLADSVKEIEEIEQELLDRFGPLPEPTRNLLRVSQLRLAAREKNIKYINTDDRKIELTLEGPLGEKVKGLSMLQEKYGFSISVNNQNTLVLKSHRSLTLEALEDLMKVI